MCTPDQPVLERLQDIPILEGCLTQLLIVHNDNFRVCKNTPLGPTLLPNFWGY